MDGENKVALVDCDGVLADFTTRLLERIGKPGERIDQWAFFDQWGDEKKIEIFKAMNSASIWEELKPLEGAKCLVRGLKEAGYRVVCVTTPYEGCPTWVHVRRKWLRKYFKIQPQDVIFARDKTLINGDFLVEDKYENALNFAVTNDKPSFLITHDYNENLTIEDPRVIRVNYHEEIFNHLGDKNDLESNFEQR